LGGACSRHGDKRGVHKALMGRPEERDHLEGHGLGGRIILKWILKDWNGEAWTGLVWLR
jgi:hypothetical protein